MAPRLAPKTSRRFSHRVDDILFIITKIHKHFLPISPTSRIQHGQGQQCHRSADGMLQVREAGPLVSWLPFLRSKSQSYFQFFQTSFLLCSFCSFKSCRKAKESPQNQAQAHSRATPFWGWSRLRPSPFSSCFQVSRPWTRGYLLFSFLF